MSEFKDIGYWSEKIYELQKEAKTYGVSSAIVLVESDPLDETENKHVNHCGMGPLMMMGAGHYLLECAKTDLEPTEHKT